MKKIFAVIMIICMVLPFTACVEERTKTSDYQYMYGGIVKEWNKQTTKEERRDSLLGFGEYLYNSYLILFPRETPATLGEFYFYWHAGIDVDAYAIYFSCTLSEDNYDGFAKGLNGFQITSGEQTFKPVFDDAHFSLPTYILQWSEVGDKWEVLEYVMLDKENSTAVFVYTMSELNRIERHSRYKVTPKNMNIFAENFTIYRDFENAVYDISFLEYLK